MYNAYCISVVYLIVFRIETAPLIHVGISKVDDSKVRFNEGVAINSESHDKNVGTTLPTKVKLHVGTINYVV